MRNHADAEPFFITEEVEATMLAAGYVFEPPKHVSTLRLSDVLASRSDTDLALWPSKLVDQEYARRKTIRHKL